MADATHIEWTDATWNVVTGCSVVSPGCTNCYAMKLAGTRLRNHPSRAGLTAASKAGPVWTGEVRLNADWLDQPLRWTRPRRIFVAAHGDLFHDGVTDDQLDQIFAVMALCPQHTFQVLTKRPERMRAYLRGLYAPSAESDARVTHAVNDVLMSTRRTWGDCGSTGTAITTLSRGIGAVEPGILRNRADGNVERLVDWKPPRWMTVGAEFADRVRARLMPAEQSEFGWGLKLWPLPNVWLGVSVEDQVRADERIPILLDTPAAVRWISAEPLLGPIDLTALPFPKSCDCPDHSPTLNALTGDVFCGGCCEGPEATTSATLDWGVYGGESGPDARPMHPDWVRQGRDQFAAGGVPFLFKQWGEWTPGENAQNTIGKAVETADWFNQRWDFQRLTAGDCEGMHIDDEPTLYRAGKKAAGRRLDGVLHDGYPEVRS